MLWLRNLPCGVLTCRDFHGRQECSARASEGMVIKMAQIEVNQEKCVSQEKYLSQEKCHKCIEACPQRLLWTYPKGKRKPGKSAEDWVIAPILPSLCTACMACEKACPQGAIKVITGVESAATAGNKGIKRAARRLTAGTCVWLAQKAYVP